MRTKLQKYFPMIKTRQAILDEIDGNAKMHSVFYSWEKKQKEEFLDFCTGVKGVKLLYDSFFKQIMNPETAPRRLEEFISAAIGEKVKILHVLSDERGFRDIKKPVNKGFFKIKMHKGEKENGIVR